MADEHPLKPFYSVLVLAFGCSLLVAFAAVGLRPLQDANRQLDQKKNILRAAGIYNSTESIAEQFSAVESKIVDLQSGEYVPDEKVDPENYDQLEAALSDESGRLLERTDDPAGVRRLENYSRVYLVRENGTISQVVVPVRGKGLWSTMYAYVAVADDLNTITGISFYEHGETAGLGGEVANPRWQAGWQQKKLYGPGGDVALDLVKSGSQGTPEDSAYQVDGLSGATLTSKGVENLIHFWFGENGFKPYFKRIREQGGFNG
ncbi:MAG: Na(+)-translocating NADH-quinone reductase subunit C [Desulfocapsaceae bacterium]|jgi:Na+-transporting NADH:ubiquinone oxidoreductase subunit C|nr:Na(+)-translocating NADH-quinone reductase subunit C [Desulfocapsaceae bacterium]